MNVFPSLQATALDRSKAVSGSVTLVIRKARPQ